VKVGAGRGFERVTGRSEWPTIARPAIPTNLADVFWCIMGLQELTVERYEGVAEDQRILLLKGPITIETTPQFERAVRSEQAETVILDLSDVPYVDSVGLGSLIATYVSLQKRGHCLVLTGVNPRVDHVMEITRVKDFFLTFRTTWEAVEALANTGSA